jgi:hypothetical protein
MSGKIYGKYWAYSLMGGFIGIAAAIVSTLLLSDTIRPEVAKGLNGVAVTFSLTFVAFSVTALALLQLLQDKEWYKEIRKSAAFKSFMARFFLSIKLNLGLFLASLLSLLLLPAVPDMVLRATTAVLSGGMAFIAIWVWSCLTTFVSLFME